MLRKLEWVFDDLVIDFHRVFSILSERNKSCNELIENNTQGPQINREGVSLSRKSFRSHVVRGSNHCESFFSSIESLAGAKIDEFKISICTDHDIFGLEIAVDERFFMESLNNMKKLGTIEHCLL